MNIETVKKISSMPLASPSYPSAPFYFVNREYLIISYLSDPEAIRAAVPEPLDPDGSNTVLYEFIKMPDSSGFGDYTETGIVIPCVYQNEPVNYTAQMYLDCDPPIAGGREIWGFPKKYGNPKLEVFQDTLTGTFSYAGERVALGTMAYKHESLLGPGIDPKTVAQKLMKTQVNLKIIPGASGGYDVVQLVAYNLQDVHIKGAWVGPARLDLISHVNAPVADLPVKKISGGLHMVADLTLPLGRVLFDYLKSN
jgi:acetoacetate decarboxylase